MNTMMEMGIKPRLMAIKEAAMYVGLPRSQLFEYISQGEIQSIKHGQKRTLIKLTELDRLADRIEAGEFAGVKLAYGLKGTAERLKADEEDEQKAA